MPHRKKDGPDLFQIITMGAGVALVVAAVSWVQDYSKFRSDMADKPYVETRFVEGKKYSDDIGNAVLGKAYAYSDANRQATTLKMEEIKAEMRESNAKLSTQIEQLIRTVEGATWKPRK